MRKGFRPEYRKYVSTIRQKQNLSQRQLALAMGMAVQNYYKFESGTGGFEFEIRFFFKLARILKVPFLEIAIAEAEYRNNLDTINEQESLYRYEPTE